MSATTYKEIRKKSKTFGGFMTRIRKEVEKGTDDPKIKEAYNGYMDILLSGMEPEKRKAFFV